jgi:hypothetical protein
MAKRKEERYRFIASTGVIKIPDYIKENDILLIINAVDGIIIANQLDPGKGYTVTYNPPPVTDPDFIYAIDGFTEITLEYDTSGMSDTDSLTIYIDIGGDRRGLTVRPYAFGTDAIERVRIAQPQSLIDADFEYGLQNTKWQSIGLNRSIPTFFEFTGSALSVTDIASQGAATYSTIRVTVAAGTALAVGTPVSIVGTTNPLAEGLFIIIANNSPTLSTFDVLAKGSVASGSIFTPYSVVKQGGIYTGASMDISTMSGNGAGGKVTIVFGSPHGLVPGSPLTVSDTGAGAQSHEGSFFVEQVVNGTTVIYDAGQTVTDGSITTTTISVFARNDSFFIHRPFDGGVLLGPSLPIHGLEAKRQTKRYFRYQSGKGILFSTGTLLNPVFDIQNATYSSPDISFTTQLPHGLQRGAEVRVYGITSANYNGEFRVTSITNETTFKVTPLSAPTDATAVLEAQPRVAVTKWSGASIRCGIFDDDNGMFWEYDGQHLYIVKRSSTFQLAGTVALANDSKTVTGTNTRFTEQLKVGDRIVIRGQSSLVTSITSDTSLSISPKNRGATVTGVKPTIVREVRVPQNQFNYDRIDGVNSPSGYTINLAKMQMIGIQYSWYGAGFIDYMLRGPLGEFLTAHRIANNNVNDEAYMRSGNLPARYEVVNTAAIDKLSVNTGLTTTSLNLNDASRFPDASGDFPEYVMITSNQSGTIYQEVLSYTGKSANQLTGVTTATSYSNYLAGATRTFSGSTNSYDHPKNSSVILLNTTCAPSISHWGSAVIMDGGFDIDDGYQFNYSRTGISITGNTSSTVLLFRAAPSVSDTIPGLLGEREVLNRSQIKFREIEVNNNSARNIQISAILNPTNVGAATWVNANTRTVGAASVFQPSFAQVALTGGTILGGTAPANGEILFQFLSSSGTTTFDLREIKEVQNSVIGGNNTYPDGPEVVALYVTNNNAQAASIDIVLKWTEAQA